MRARAFLAGLLALASLAGAPDPARSEPPRPAGPRFAISAPAGAPSGEVVRGGVPFPREPAVLDPARLGVWREDGRDGGAWVASQWHVVSRWGGAPEDASRPVRWAVVDFVSRAPGVHRVRDDAPPAAPVPSVAAEDADRIDVDTGPLRFSVRKDRFAPLADLRTVVADGAVGTRDRPAVRDGGLDVRLVLEAADDAGVPSERTYLASRGALREAVLEENGPVAATVRLRGRFADDEGRPILRGFLGWTIRLRAERGADRVRVTFTLENDGTSGPTADASRARSERTDAALREVALVVPTTLAGGRIRGATSAGTWDVASFGDGPDFRLTQSHDVRDPQDESRNFRAAVTVGGREVWTGARSGGAVEADDGVLSVAACVRDFWQNAPQRIAVDDGRIEVHLWPRREDGRPEILDGGRHRSHEVLLAFAPSGAAPPVARRESVFQAPPAISLDPSWVRRTGAVPGAFALVEGAMPSPSLDEARALLERRQNAIVDLAWADASDDGVAPADVGTLRETRGHGPGGVPGYDLDLHGWRAFGDLPHPGGYAAGHHDWVRGLFLGWLRHARRPYLDRALEALVHRTGPAQYHCRDRSDPGGRWHDGFQRADRGRMGADGHPESPPSAGATWLEGLLLAYAVTGDPRAAECARENAEAFVAAFEADGLADGSAGPRRLGARDVANGVGQLLAFHEFTGDRRARDVALAAFERGLLADTDAVGIAGLIPAGPGSRPTEPVVALLRPLVETHRITGDPRALALLVRVLGFLRDAALVGGETAPGGARAPVRVAVSWDVEGGRLVPRAGHAALGLLFADGLAYAYARTGEPSFLELSRTVWRDAVLFLGAPPDRPLAPDHTDPASYVLARDPGSEARVGAWVLGASQYVLALEDSLRTRAEGPPPFDDGPWFERRREVASARPLRRPAPRTAEEPAVFVPWEPDEPDVRPADAPVVLDDGGAEFAGPWETVHGDDALGGTAHIASGPGATATWRVTLPAGGTWRVSLRWPDVPGARRDVPVVVRQGGGWTRAVVDQTRESGRWRIVATVAAVADRPLEVLVGDASGDGARGVVVDGLRVERVAEAGR